MCRLGCLGGMASIGRDPWRGRGISPLGVPGGPPLARTTGYRTSLLRRREGNASPHCDLRSPRSSKSDLPRSANLRSPILNILKVERERLEVDAEVDGFHFDSGAGAKLGGGEVEDGV